MTKHDKKRAKKEQKFQMKEVTFQELESFFDS